MAGVLLFFTAIAITYWALIPVAVVVVGGLRYVVSKLVRSSQSQSAKIVKEGLSFSLSISLAYAGGLFRMVVIKARNLLAGANFIPAKNSSRSNEDQWLASCNSYLLPEDLVIDQILSRLPVKSLMRFKSVCKRWHSLPTNPSFIASHLKRINTHNRLASWNGNDNGLIVSHDGFHVFSVRDIASFQPVNLKFGFDRKADLVLGPCDGIFCLYWRPIERFGSAAVPRVERLPTIVLWNPATRAFSILPMSKFDFPPHKKVSDCMVGFGFDLKSKSIKVVKVVTFCRSEDIEFDYVNCAEVYDLSSAGSWRVLHVDDVPQNVFVSNDLTDSMYNSNDGVFHWHSCLRWSSIDEESLYVELVLSFDMSTELFHVTLLPEKFNIFYLSLNYEGRECYLSLLRDSLAVNFSVFKKDERHSIVEVWVMKKNFDRVVEAGVSFSRFSSYSWSHELTLELSDPTPRVLMGFWSKNELRMLERDCSRETLFLYDYVTKQARDLQLSGEPNFLYRESLVSIKGGCGNGQFVFK